jgi:hypothetical protein
VGFLLFFFYLRTETQPVPETSLVECCIFIRQLTKSNCSVTAIAMPNVPIYSYRRASWNTFIYQEVRRPQSVNYVLESEDKNTDLKRNANEYHSKHISRGQNMRMKPTQRLWLLAYCEWIKSDFHYRKSFRELGHVQREQTEGTAVCGVTYRARFGLFSSAQFAALWCSQTHSLWFDTPVGLHGHLPYTQICYDNVFLHVETISLEFV